MTIKKNGDWIFAPRFDRARREQLESISSFEDITETIYRQIYNILVKVDPGRDPGLVHCLRPIIVFDVEPDTFDAFFNSPVGYRAQFLADPCMGQAANCRLIHRLLPKFVNALTKASGLSKHQFELSLIALSSKIWVYEDEFPFSNVTEDLAVDVWVAEAKAGHQKAKWGLCAPTGSKLEVKGAFLDPAENEVVQNRKIGRRFEIAKYGFS